MSEITKANFNLREGLDEFNYLKPLAVNLTCGVESGVYTNAQTICSKTSGIIVWDNCSIQNCYESGNNPYDHTRANFGATSQLGIVSPYVENELMETYKTQLSTEGSYSKIYVPQFATGVTYYQDSQWVWLTNGSNYFFKDKGQIYFSSSETVSYCITNSFYNGTAVISAGTFDNFGVIEMEIAAEMRRNSSINFFVGGAVKVFNYVSNTYKVYLCSTHVANIKDHQADFPIFLTSALCKNITITDDKPLCKSLEANNLTVEKFKKIIK